MLAAKLLLDGTWRTPGVHVPEDLDPDPFMRRIGEFGLPWKIENDPQMQGALQAESAA